ncbi:MAG TPA: SdpI family protein [Pseudonocardiaceae bacterium]|nr:SdpI family protein [Pseudonocardiaceae bacterium]
MSASTLLAGLLLAASASLLTVGLLGWRRWLPRNRFAGIRTPATLRSEVAFIAANRVAAPPVLGSAAICAAGGALALGTGGWALTLIAGIAGAGAVGLVLAGGLLGHRVALAMPPVTTPGCEGCGCGGGGCGAR